MAEFYYERDMLHTSRAAIVVEYSASDCLVVNGAYIHKSGC